MVIESDKSSTQSASWLLLYRTYLEIWQRGEKYADQAKVVMQSFDEKHIDAIVKGSKKYHVRLEFRGGGLSRSCDCPYIQTHSDKIICKHMVAVAIVWDEARGLERPTPEEIEAETIPPPAVSYSQVEVAFADPVKADLDIIRIAADELGWGGRPHARLPNMPKFATSEKEPLNLAEVKKSFQEIEQWENRRNFDYYFCAGEMVAAFCEVLRIIKKRLPVSDSLAVVEILRTAQKFHYKLILEMIDDSDGLHQFSEAHLEDIYQELKKMKKNNGGILEKLKEFDKHRDDY